MLQCAYVHAFCGARHFHSNPLWNLWNNHWYAWYRSLCSQANITKILENKLPWRVFLMHFNYKMSFITLARWFWMNCSISLVFILFVLQRIVQVNAKNSTLFTMSMCRMRFSAETFRFSSIFQRMTLLKIT